MLSCVQGGSVCKTLIISILITPILAFGYNNADPNLNGSYVQRQGVNLNETPNPVPGLQQVSAPIDMAAPAVDSSFDLALDFSAPAKSGDIHNTKGVDAQSKSTGFGTALPYEADDNGDVIEQ